MSERGRRTKGRQLRMKRTPLLAFEVDPAVISGSRVEEVLRRIRTSETGPEANPDDDAD